jgi:hypothetical protein
MATNFLIGTHGNEDPIAASFYTLSIYPLADIRVKDYRSGQQPAG